MTVQELQEALRNLVQYAEDGDDPETWESLCSASTFEEEGVLTMNAGLVLRFTDGSAFQVTLVQSEAARS